MVSATPGRVGAGQSERDIKEELKWPTSPGGKRNAGEQFHSRKERAPGQGDIPPKQNVSLSRRSCELEREILLGHELTCPDKRSGPPGPSAKRGYPLS